MKQKITAALFTVVLMLGQTTAQMRGPAIDAARARLSFLVGTFVTETTIPARSATSKSVTGKGTSAVAWALDSAFLAIDEQSTNPLFGQYRGHGMLGFDPNTHEYVLSMFNNFGDHPSYKGNFVADTLVLTTKVAMPGGAFDQKLLWWREGTRVRLMVFNDLGKGPGLALEQTYIPVSSKQP